MELSEQGNEPSARVSIGRMHLAKGLEFKAVAVMACDEETLPLQSRIEAAADEGSSKMFTRLSVSFSMLQRRGREIAFSSPACILV